MSWIDKNVLDRLGELTSERGDSSTVRKLKTAMQPLSASEAAWIEETIRQIIWRVGDQRPVSEWPMIGMADMPPL